MFQVAEQQLNFSKKKVNFLIFSPYSNFVEINVTEIVYYLASSLALTLLHLMHVVWQLLNWKSLIDLICHFLLIFWITF